MSEEAEKSAAGAPKKSKLGLIIAAVIAVLTLVGGSVAGAVLGPKLLGSSAAGAEGKAEPAAAEKESDGTPPAPATIVSVDIPSLVVDLRDEEGRIRHLKVGLTAELADKVTPDEFKLLTPRAREASLTYLRTLTYEDVSDPEQFLGIKEELGKRVTTAVGGKYVHRLVLTDFVLQ